MQESDYFLVILVDAKHLDYSNNRAFFRSVMKHPVDGSRDGTVGHAWFYLRGRNEGNIFELEGGHSGERGMHQAKYFDGIMNYNDYGYANPTKAQISLPRYEPDPVKYLWEHQSDGFFQKGNGGHRPHYAAKIDLTHEQFEAILEFVSTYPYASYGITDNQCSQFVTQIAAIADWPLSDKVSMAIEPVFIFRAAKIRMWSDPAYATITFSSPDELELSLRQSVASGRAQPALNWYRSRQAAVR